MRALKIVGVILLILVLIPLIMVSFFGGSVAKAVVRSVNKNLQTEISIGEYDVGFLSTFPNLSVNLLDVQVEGSDGSDLLIAEKVSCLLDLGSLFGKVRVEEIVVEDGLLQLMVDVDGNSNYQLTGYTPVGEEVPDNPDAEAMEFAVADARLKGVEVVYRNAQLEVDLAGTINRLSFSGDFGNDNYLMSTEGSLDIFYVDQSGERFLHEQEVQLSAETKIDNVNNGYTFAPLLMTAGELELKVVGDLQSTQDGLVTDLRVESQSGSLEDVLALIPPAYAGGLNELETRGELTLTSDISGAWTQRAYPRFDGRLTFTNGRVGSPRMNVGVRDLNLKAVFTYLDGARGGMQTFAIEELTGMFRNQPFELALKVDDLNDPQIDFSANGAFALGTLPALMGYDAITDGEGYVEVDNLRLKGRYEDMLRPRRMGNVSASGRLTFDDGEITVNDRELNFPSGTLELNDNEMVLTDFAFSGPGTEISFTGKATNLIPVLFADSLNTNDAELDFEARLTGESIDLDELLSLAGPTEEEEELAEAAGKTDSLRAKTMARRTQITDLLRGRFDAQVDNWNYGEIEGEDFKGQLFFEPRKLDVTGITQSMEGELKVDGTVYFAELQRVEGRVRAKAIDVNEFFRQSENFSQEVLVDDNLEGTMDARIFIQAYFDEVGAFDYEKLRVLADLDIKDGELNNFGMLENFAFALKAGDLDRVRFTRLQNFFEITEQTIYIPTMFVQSSALNLELSGSHTFNNYLDYFIKVNAGQAIANKIKRHDRNLDMLPSRRNGFFNLYYTVEGPLETFTVENDKRAVKNDFRRSEFRKERIRKELERYFSEPIELLEAPAENEDIAEE
ncbi:AsmA-like C-terminal region-containing protein [Neolewinella agarilytica]|uniref:AsmA-like C-terminal region n=1 Tax=Neolewinella agarilytica TaxID=478744 RepID=A0A1H9A912_9BACT|nr:AsmA-like C-terminal region-containing protein [Neolewinella agarilytica]SEP73154.1 AsmA-like C-terminal region [Neolewinella agarilytica]